MQLKEYNKFHNDRYELKHRLGGGGFSEVWLAEDLKANRAKVALKVYASVGGLDEEGVEMFSNEFALLLNYNHSNILKPMHFDECEKRPYLVMRYCEHGSAKRFVGEITEEAAWQLLHDVSAGLAYLHNLPKPVIHQDISPDNILISERSEFLLTDFGISTQARSTLRKNAVDLQASQAGGKVDYMGPERFSASNEPIKASDIWALGATMYELLEGRLPFPMGLGGLAQKGGADIPEIKGKYSKELKELVYKMLAKETWDRPTAEVIHKQTAEHLKGGGDGTSKMKMLWIVIAAAVAAAVVGILVHFVSHSDAEPREPKVSSVTNQSFTLHGRTFVYTGDVKENEFGELLPNGIGKAVYEAGDLYIVANDSAVLADTTVIPEEACTYDGRFRDGYRIKGLLTYQDFGHMYDGAFKDDYFDGMGKYTWDDGDYFNGEWKNNDVWDGTLMSKNGQPRATYKNGKCVWKQ